jgi:SAM-dependent methyltransferase
VSNAAFEPELVAYSPAYDNSQHFSSTFREYATHLVDRLIATYDLRNVSVVDIGCGRGDLLALIASRGGNRGFGFDPSFDPGTSTPASPGISICQQYFTREHSVDLAPALVCCRHVLEHVPDPIAFLCAMREAVSNDRAPIIYLEVPNGEHQLHEAGIWDYIYEHCSYFSRRSLQLTLRAAGFEVLRLEEGFGGQFLCADVRPALTATATRMVVGPTRAIVEVRAAISGLQQKLTHWMRWAEAIGNEQRKATIWGAGSKGVMFLNLLGFDAPNPIEFVIDQNPNKHGRYLACCGQVVSDPARLAESPVEEVVVMNQIYLGEVRDRMTALGVAPRILTA